MTLWSDSVSQTDLDALVIGAGVAGLTTAICLAEAGLRVRIWTAERPQETTSIAAQALWGPYLVEPVDRVRVWSDRTLGELRKLATDPDTGVDLVSGTEASRTAVDPPDWSGRMDGFRICEVGELPEGFVTGWRYTVPAVDMPIYLSYLERRLMAAGGSIEIRRFDSLAEAASVARLVVNCAGMCARDLVPTPSLCRFEGNSLWWRTLASPSSSRRTRGCRRTCCITVRTARRSSSAVRPRSMCGVESRIRTSRPPSSTAARRSSHDCATRGFLGIASACAQPVRWCVLKR